MHRVRLDQRLVDLGLEPTRSQARQRILAGQVQLDGRVIDRPGARVAHDAVPVLQAEERYVSRGGQKLAFALRAFAVDPRGLRCIDAGAGTGGFTDCLLQRGARSVLALDVGRGQLAPALLGDPRVESLEAVNVRDYALPAQAELADLLVADLAFISLAKVLPSLCALVRAGGELLLLVKPQFELDPDAVGGGGVVRDPLLRAQALERVAKAAREQGLQLLGACVCPVHEERGNREAFALLRKPSPAAASGAGGGPLRAGAAPVKFPVEPGGLACPSCR